MTRRDEIFLALGLFAGVMLGAWWFRSTSKAAELRARARLAEVELTALELGLQIAAVTAPARA